MTFWKRKNRFTYRKWTSS